MTGQSETELLALAEQDIALATAVSAEALLAEHTSAWAQLWTGGVEVVVLCLASGVALLVTCPHRGIGGIYV